MSGNLDLDSTFSSNGNNSLNSTSSYPADENSVNWNISMNSNLGDYGNEHNAEVRSPSDNVAGIQRSVSYGAVDNRKPAAHNFQRFVGGASLDFKSRNPIRLKKNSGAEGSKSREISGSSRSGGEASSSAKAEPEKTLPYEEYSDADVLDYYYTEYLGNFILEQLAKNEEQELLNLNSDREMNYLQPLWIDTVPNLQMDILNQDIIEKVKDLEAVTVMEKNLDSILAGIETRFEQNGNELLATLSAKTSILRIRNLKLQLPADMNGLLLCLAQFREFFIKDTNVLMVVSKILTAERQLADAENMLLKWQEKELIPYHELLKMLISLGLSVIAVDKCTDDHRLSLTGFGTSGFLSSTPRRYQEYEYLAFPDTDSRSYESFLDILLKY